MRAQKCTSIRAFYPSAVSRTQAPQLRPPNRNTRTCAKMHTHTRFTHPPSVEPRPRSSGLPTATLRRSGRCVPCQWQCTLYYPPTHTPLAQIRLLASPSRAHPSAAVSHVRSMRGNADAHLGQCAHSTQEGLRPPGPLRRPPGPLPAQPLTELHALLALLRGTDVGTDLAHLDWHEVHALFNAESATPSS